MLDYFFKNAWKWKCGIPEEDMPKHMHMPELDILMATQFPQEFTLLNQLADKRMITGSFRYGDINRAKLGYDPSDEILSKVEAFKKDRNLEHLVDAYNMIRIAFRSGLRNGEKITPIDDGIHISKHS